MFYILEQQWAFTIYVFFRFSYLYFYNDVLREIKNLKKEYSCECEIGCIISKIKIRLIQILLLPLHCSKSVWKYQEE